MNSIEQGKIVPKNEEIIFVETSILVSNKFKEELYVVDKAYESLKLSIENFGIKEPLIAERINNIIISGNRRLKVAIEIGLKEIPVIYRDLKDTDREILYITHENQREKTYSQYLNEYKIIQKRFPLTQGTRTDLKQIDALNAEALRTLTGVSRTTLFYLSEIDKIASKKYKLGVLSNTYRKIWNDLDEGYKTPRYWYEKLKPKSKINNKIDFIDASFNFEPCSFFNKSCEDLTDLIDNSVSTFISSPPYYGYNKKYGNLIPSGIGTESSPKEYIENLVKIYKNTLIKLKKDGSIWVNLTESIIDGEYHLIPHQFAMKMKEIGIVINDIIIWNKINSQYTKGKRSVKNHEYLFHFIKASDKKTFNYDVTWLENSNDLKNKISYFNGEKDKNLKGFLDFRDGVLTTKITNIEKLRKECSKRKIKCDNDSTFPIDVAMIPILTTSQPQDIVVDLFGGVGTVALVGGALDRKTISYEINSDYCNAANMRLTDLISSWESIDDDSNLNIVNSIKNKAA